MDASHAVEALADGLAAAHFEVTREAVVDGAVLMARRADWKSGLARMHTFVVVFTVGELTAERADELTAAAQQYAIDHKGGLPRGLQTGTLTIAVFLGRASEPAVRWFAAEPKHRYAALRFPVLAVPDTGALTYFKGRMSRGYSYGADVRGVVEKIVAPAIKPAR
jgi:uncharacterized membrane protein